MTVLTLTETRKPYEKKGQFAGAVGAVITLIVGVGVSVLVLIFVGALGGQTYNLVEPDIDLIYQSVTRQPFLALNGTAATLRDGSINSGSLAIVNSTNQTIGLGNFTISYGNPATLTLKSNLQSNTTMYANYTYGDSAVEDSVKNSSVSGFAALEQTGNYLPIIVLAVVIALVLMLVLGFTAFGGGGDGSSRSAL